MPEEKGFTLPEDESKSRAFPINLTLSDWLKIILYAVALFSMYFNMDGRIHALELTIAQMRIDEANFTHADVLKVRDEALSDQLREITRRLGTIENKVDNIETKPR